ncbi:MAG: PAS domain S-box protein [Candidatus Thermoplasmatota archaeon]|nr:PAS domain S-box protein [Candidatus Thermoplasmatota archaeon]
MKIGDEGVREVIAELKDKIAALGDFVDLYASVSQAVYSFVLDRHGSTAAVQRQRKPLPHLQGVQFLELVGTEDRKRAADLFVRCLEGERIQATLSLRLPGQEEKSFVVAALPRKQDERIVGVQGVAREEMAPSSADLDLVNLVREPLCTTDLVGNVTRANQALADLLDVSLQRLRGTNLADWIDEADVPAFREQVRKALHGEAASMEGYVVAASGIKVPVVIAVTEMHDQGGLLLSVTKKTGGPPEEEPEPAAEGSLYQQLEEELKRVHELGAQPPDTREEVCERAARLLTDLFSPDSCYVGLVDGDVLRIAAGEGLDRERLSLHEDCLPCSTLESGEVRLSPGTPEVSEVCLPLVADHQPLGVMGITRLSPPFSDYEQFLLKQVAHQASQSLALAGAAREVAKYKSIFTRAVEGIYRTTLDGCILETNPAFRSMFGYEGREDDLRLVPASHLYAHPEEREGLVRRLREEGVVENFETRYVTRAKKKFYGRESAWLVTRHGETVIEGMIRDITPRKKLEEDAKFYNSLLRHDIYNKNEIAIGYLGLLKDSHLSPKDEELISKAVKAVAEGNKLIETVKKLEAVKEQQDLKNIRLDDLMQRIIDTYQEEAERRDIQLRYLSSGAVVRGNELMEDLFSNLVKNAVQHSHAQHVTVYAEDDERGWYVFVEDDGVGIPSDQKEKIFQQGWKGAGSPGSGLGLYLAQKIAEGFGGSIRVESGEPEFQEGTRFVVWLRKGRQNNRIVGHESEVQGVRW